MPEIPLWLIVVGFVGLAELAGTTLETAGAN